jgi:hypothetical protein
MLLARLAGVGELFLVALPLVLFDVVLAGAIAVLLALIPAARRGYARFADALSRRNDRHRV